MVGRVLHHNSSEADPFARFIINDTFRSDLCLLYPPHLIAIAAIYLTLVLNISTRNAAQSPPSSNTYPQVPSSHASSGSGNPRRSSRSSNHNRKSAQDVVGFMAGLNVNTDIIASVAQEIISLYALWERYKEDTAELSARGSFTSDPPSTLATALKRSASGSLKGGGTARSRDATPVDAPQRQTRPRQPAIITPTFLVQQLLKMREGNVADIAHPATGRPVALDKRLERTQNA